MHCPEVANPEQSCRVSGYLPASGTYFRTQRRWHQVALHDSWCRFLRATPTDEQEFEFAELLNLLETCCALYPNRSFTSKPRKLLQRYLVEVFTHLADDANARERLRDLKDTSETFAKIEAFETARLEES